MSSTRRKTDPGGEISQERYMSSPELTEARGLIGTPVAARASVLYSAKKRSLLHFLQAMSLRPGGMNRLAKEILAAFPERIGCPAMHKAGIRPGGRYSAAVIEDMKSQLGLGVFDDSTPVGSIGGQDIDEDLYAILYPNEERRKVKEQCACSVDKCLEICRYKARSLPDVLTDLCINPRMEFAAPGDTDSNLEFEREQMEESIPKSDRGRFVSLSVPYFKDLAGALFEFQRRHGETIRRDFALTSIAVKTWETLDACLKTRKAVVIEGNARIGKTTAAEAWCNCHLGEARFISLSGINNKTSLFRAMARALGITAGFGHSVTTIQAKVEAHLEATHLMVVFDEAHFLLPQQERIYSRPELVDWCNTALYNRNVPAAFVCTPQFALRMAKVESETAWNGNQFKGRIKRYTRLPATPTREDLFAVANKLLPECGKGEVGYVVGYALTSERFMPAIVDAIDEARLIAEAAGRSAITMPDIVAAIENYCRPSDEAKSRAFATPVKTRKRTGFGSPAMPDKAPFKGVETALSEAGRDTNLASRSLATPARLAMIGREGQEALAGSV